jgi:hypothetical protein
MTGKKDNIGDVYSLLLFGIILIAFLGGYFAGSQKEK